MGQQTSNPSLKKAHFSNKKLPSQSTTKSNLRHEGILRIAKTPFQNCQKIQIDSQVYFLQNTKTNLQQLIKYKTRVKKYFTEEDIIRMIQNLVYTLAYLEDAHVPYPYLILENIYVCNGKYKLLPPQTIKNQLYSKLKTIIKQKIPQYVPASPELIIASRCQQPEIYQQQILFKSNIFALGLVLLQVCTLKSSSDCYDIQTYDILDQIVMERIQEIQGRYSGKIVRIVANMLDYDYEERMMPKDMSIWINREINEGEGNGYVKATPSFPKNQIKLDNAEMIKSRLVQQPSKSPKANIERVVEPIQSGQTPQVIQQKPRLRNSEQRISQIRNKIIKQKIKAQKQIIQQKDLSRSQKKRTTSIVSGRPNDNRGLNRNLHNPYLNPNHLNKSTEKPSRNRSPYLPLPVENKDLGIHDLKKLRPTTYVQKYSYTNQDEDLVSDRDRSPSNVNFNLKYKYNISDEEGESVRLSSNRKRDGDRFVRVQKCLAEFQRAGSQRVVGSGKKYDYGQILGECYENKETRKLEDREDNRVLSRSPYRNYQQATNISDFSFEPPKTQTKQKSRKQSKQFNQKPRQQQKPKQQPLGSRQNYNDMIKKQLNLEKVVKNSAPSYQRHQQLFNEGNKPIKFSKQNEDILMIKKQIERSKKLIQEVKKNEIQNNS